jgi:hypothetical protein
LRRPERPKGAEASAKIDDFDCLDRLTPGEPYFVLRAQDALSPELIEAWAIEAELNHCPSAKVSNARAIAAAMRKWPHRKTPD